MALAADQCRDARGTAFVDDLARDILYAFRTFRRAPLAALTIVATVALGLGLVTVVFTVYNTIFLRVDAVRSPGELFAVERPTGPGADASLPFTRPEYEAMRRETSVFTDAFAMLRPVRTRIEGRPVSSALVTGNFFQVLGVQAALGRPLTPGDDERFAGRPVIVLSHRGWNKLFAGDPAVIGRSVLVNGLPYEIVGVMPEDFRGLGILPARLLGATRARRAVPRRLCRKRGRDRHRGRRAAEAGDVAGGGDGRAHRVGVGTNRSADGPPGVPPPSG